MARGKCAVTIAPGREVNVIQILASDPRNSRESLRIWTSVVQVSLSLDARRPKNDSDIPHIRYDRYDPRRPNRSRAGTHYPRR